MRILFLAAADSTHTVRWVNALSERGHEVYLICNKGHAPKIDNLSEKVKLYLLKHAGMKGYYLNSLELRKITKTVKPDVINVHYASGYGTLARIARVQPTLLSVWGSDVYEFPYQSKCKEKILKKNLRYARGIAATSYCMAEQVRKVLDDSQKEIAVTPFGIDISKFAPWNEEKENSNIVIGNVKSLKAVYGIEDLIKAFNILYQELNNENKCGIAELLRLEIYGDGEDKGKLEKLIRSLRLEDKIILKGKIPNEQVPKVLNKMDIFCATSLRESFGVSLLEAMAMKLPIVATDTVGFKEIVGDAGLVVDTGNIEKISKALKRLVLDTSLRKEYGEKGRKRVKELYDWDENVSKMEILYDKYIVQNKERIWRLKR